MREFDLIIQGILHGDKIGHPFVVNIKFDTKNASEKNYFSTKFIHQYLREKKFCRQTKDQFFNFSSP